MSNLTKAMLKHAVIVCVAALLVIVAGLVAGGGQETVLRHFKDVLAAARQLESVGMVLNAESSDEAQAKRRNLLFAFMREPKSDVAHKHYQQVVKSQNEFKVKAYQYVAEIKSRNGNWLTKIMSFGGPLGAMKNLAKSDEDLAALVQEYESKAQAGKTGGLTDARVDQDLAKHSLRHLDAIMHVLSTDIKYLAIENVPLLNVAIYSQLKASKFLASNNFYLVDELTEGQKRLLRDFYASRVDQEKTTIGEASGHFEEPGGLIIGRLLDSCHTVAEIGAFWEEAADACGSDCGPSGSFSANHSIGRFDDVVNLCDQFLEAL